MQHLFCQFTQRLAVEFFVERFNLRIFVAQTQLHSIIAFIQTFNAFFTQRIAFVFFIFRLTTATNATTRASHNFYKMIISFASFNFFNKLTSVGSTVNNSNFHLQTVNIYNSIANAFHTTHRLQIVKACRNFFLSNQSVSTTNCSFHYATGVTKNYASTAAFAHEVVKIFFRQISEVNIFIFGKHCQLTSSDNIIHITHAFDAQIFGSSVHFVSANFKFFRSTGSEGNVNNFSGINAHFLSKVSFNGRTLHSNRALSAGNMVSHFRIIGFHEFNPSRAAAGKLRQRFSTFSNAFNKFAAFFHNGQIRRKVSVQNIIYTQFTEQRNHFTLNEAAISHTKFFTQSNANRRRSANDNNLIRIANLFSNLVNFYSFSDGIHRANISTLTAVNTNRIVTSFCQVISTAHADVIGANNLASTAFYTFKFQALDGRILRRNCYTNICKFVVRHKKYPPS